MACNYPGILHTPRQHPRDDHSYVIPIQCDYILLNWTPLQCKRRHLAISFQILLQNGPPVYKLWR